MTQSFQAELRSYVEDIKTKAEIVQRDIELVKVRLDREEQQLQTQERKEASDSRKHIIAWTSMYIADKRAIEARKKKSAAGLSNWMILIRTRYPNSVSKNDNDVVSFESFHRTATHRPSIVSETDAILVQLSGSLRQASFKNGARPKGNIFFT